MMKTGVSDVTVETLQAFADAWNRHDVDALMSFMADDCVFEVSADAQVCGSRYVGAAAVRSGYAEVWPLSPMPIGATRATLLRVIGAFQSGRSREPGRMAPASKCMAAICSPFEMTRFS